MQNLTAITGTPNTTAIQNDRFRSSRVREKRIRKSLPPADQRSWLLLTEAASLIGCSKATAYRLRRGEIDGVPRLPTVQVAKRKPESRVRLSTIRVMRTPNQAADERFIDA